MTITVCLQNYLLCWLNYPFQVFVDHKRRDRKTSLIAIICFLWFYLRLDETYLRKRRKCRKFYVYLKTTNRKGKK